MTTTFDAIGEEAKRIKAEKVKEREEKVQKERDALLEKILEFVKSKIEYDTKSIHVLVSVANEPLPENKKFFKDMGYKVYFDWDEYKIDGYYAIPE